nr:5991_t:CDS:2 [Entrophospora candida]
MSSRQMEHAILIEVIGKSIPVLEEYDIVLDICIDGDLNSNKVLGGQQIVHLIVADLNMKQNYFEQRLQPIMSYYNKCVYAAILYSSKYKTKVPTDDDLFHMQTQVVVSHFCGNHENCWPDFCWNVDNSDLTLIEPNLINYNRKECSELVKFLEHIMKLPSRQTLISIIRTSQNKAVNHIKINYTDKKTDYPKSFPAQDALAILHNNHGVEYLLKVACEAGEIFRTGHYQYYTSIQQQRNRKRSQNVAVITERNEACIKKVMDKKENLKSFDFSKDLIPYGHIMQEKMKNTKFRLSFSFLIYNFDSLVKCQGCHSFPKWFTKNGFCVVCEFNFQHGYSKLIPNNQFHDNTPHTMEIEVLVDDLCREVFGFTKYRELQKESIISFITGHDILTVILTGGGKTLICAASELLFKGLTVVFTPLKSLMEDQLMELVKMGIPSATPLASSDQPPHVQEKIFMEIASEFYQQHQNNLLKILDFKKCWKGYQNHKESNLTTKDLNSSKLEYQKKLACACGLAI